MIQEHFDMTLTEKLTLITQVFGKIALNFWPVLLLGIVLCVIIHRQETAAGRGFRR